MKELYLFVNIFSLCNQFIGNRCLLHGVFPKEISIAKAGRLFKSGNRKYTENYHPISNLRSYSKIIERIVCLQLIYFLQTHSMLSAAQYVIKSNLSTGLACQDAVQYNHSKSEMGNETQGTYQFKKFLIEMVHKLFFARQEH